MKKKKLYIMCGIPGSGKTTWAKSHVQEGEGYISRDEIRLKLLQDGDPYFKHEDRAYKYFCQDIIKQLELYSTVYVDATHITKKSRKRLITALASMGINFENIDLIIIFIKKDLKTCLKQNLQRVGRARVPEQTLIQMYKFFEMPTIEEGFKEIIEVGDKNE